MRYGLILLMGWFAGGVALAHAGEPAPARPRVVLIGDTVAASYLPSVRDALAGEADVEFALADLTTTARRRIGQYLGLTPWDLIYCNWGLADMELIREGTGWAEGTMQPVIRLGAYESNLQILMDALLETGARLIFATTLPVSETSKTHVPSDIARYNERAVKTMKQYGIQVHDQYEWAIQRRLRLPMSADEETLLGREVARTIRQRLAMPLSENNEAAGFSPVVRKSAIAAVARAVADRQLAEGSATGPDWKASTFYFGLMAWAQQVGNDTYLDALRAIARANQWMPGPRRDHADDQAVGQLYLDLYQLDNDPAMVQPTHALFDELMAKGLDDQWTWCDALFMAPPVLARLSRITGDPKYLDAMTEEWMKEAERLYDRDHRLYHRDVRRKGRLEQNGELMFWSRGNGWVLGALARVMDEMPPNYEHRPWFETKFKDMAQRVSEIQSEDGLWRAGLLDPDTYGVPESSGSALFIYALAWGVNEGLLDRAEYESVLRKGWAGLVGCVFPDGLVGCVQPPGGGPGPRYGRAASEVYGVGTFLLAASEMYRFADP